jgi:Fic-DOC domain mobile mystery protein B
MERPVTDDLFLEADDAATPLSAEEKEGLKLTWITTRGDLNLAEQANIQDADDWAFSRKRDVLDERFLRRLHKRMLGEVWTWAGSYSREVNRRIGVDFFMIEQELRVLLDNVRYWIEHKTFSPDEIALRFHHKLTWIHPFPNGNGRHARLVTDLLAVTLGRERFTWGGANLIERAEARRIYVEALRAADGDDFAALIAFARS